MSVNSETILHIEQLTKSVTVSQEQLDLLQATNLTVTAGESIAIVGASGSGKTTLLAILAGLDTPSSGEIYLKGHPLHQLDEEKRSQIRAAHVGFIFQQFLLINSLTALENVMLPAELANQTDAKHKAEQLLAQVGLGDRLGHFPSQLSGGEQQRVAIARAFISEPDILFADEPTGNLDSKTGQQITQLLFELNKRKGTTLVLVTHDAVLAQQCQRQLEMKAGVLTSVTSHAIS